MKKPSLLPSLLSFVVFALLTGCASTVHRADSSKERLYVLSPEQPVQDVTVSVLPSAQERVDETLKFDPEQLREYVERALQKNGVISQTAAEALPRVEIAISSIRVRSNFNAVMWGFMAGNDHIDADITLRSAQGEELDKFQVSVSYALGGIGGGQESTRMGWLYEKFAEEASLELMGRVE